MPSPISQREPITLGGLVQLTLNAVLGVLTGFSIVDLTGAQTGALFALANVGVLVVVVVKTRSLVYSPDTVQRADTEAALGDLHA